MLQGPSQGPNPSEAVRGFRLVHPGGLAAGDRAQLGSDHPGGRAGSLGPSPGQGTHPGRSRAAGGSKGAGESEARADVGHQRRRPTQEAGAPEAATTDAGGRRTRCRGRRHQARQGWCCATSGSTPVIVLGSVSPAGRTAAGRMAAAGTHCSMGRTPRWAATGTSMRTRPTHRPSLTRAHPSSSPSWSPTSRNPACTTLIGKPRVGAVFAGNIAPRSTTTALGGVTGTRFGRSKSSGHDANGSNMCSILPYSRDVWSRRPAFSLPRATSELSGAPMRWQSDASGLCGARRREQRWPRTGRP